MQKSSRLIVFILLGMFPLVGMGIDLIAPSLPAISSDLHVSHTIAKNLIAIYLFGYALGNFLIGFLSDAWGRRKLIISGFLVFMMVSLLPIFFPNSYVLLFVRMLQGFSMASFGVLARAIFSDILPSEKLIRIAAMIALMWGIGPVIGPVIGGYLQYYFNWQACFYFFALYSFIGFLVVFFNVPETYFKRQPFNLTQIKNNFITIITHRLFVGLVILMGLAYSLLIVFNTLGPFLIQTQLGKSSIYFGHLALLMGVSYLIGVLGYRRLVTSYQPEKILSFAITFFLAASFFGLLAALMNNKNIWVIIIPSVCMFVACSFIYPAGMGKGLTLFRHLAGSGGAVMNLINILITSLTAFVMSFISATSAIPMNAIYFGLMLLSGLSYWFLVRL